jgi:2-polyprenyl-6-hydroxyphenyl methylase / 3-demethylubiquinone-9 3-methyltransferase
MHSHPSSNVDPAELLKFGSLAEQWWDTEGAFKPLHQLNPLRLNFVKQHAEILQGQHLVDIGCGGGIFSESLAHEGAYVLGIDLAEPVIEVARQHQQQYTSFQHGGSLEYVCQSSTTLLGSEPASFDIVTCMEMIEHVPHPQDTIQECAGLAKAGSWVFFSTLNRTLRAYLMAILGAEYILQLLPRGTHDYTQFIRPSELAEWARQAGLELKTIQGVTYHPLRQSFQLSRDTSVNYMMAFQKRTVTH